MRIAIPTDDGLTVSEHFGRSLMFAIYEVTGSSFKQIATRENTHAKDPRHTKEKECCGEKHSHRDHTSIIEVLKDVNAVIVRGIGTHIVDELVQNGKKVFYSNETGIKKTLESMIKGDLVEIGKDILEE